MQIGLWFSRHLQVLSIGAGDLNFSIFLLQDTEKRRRRRHSTFPDGKFSPFIQKISLFFLLEGRGSF